MPPPPISGCTCDRLRKLTRRVTQHYDACLAPAGLRVTQYSLLAKLDRAGPATMSALAELLDMDRTTLTRNLKPLADGGLVEVGAGADARERLVGITGAGREARRAARDHWRRAQDELNRSLGAEQVGALHALLEGALAKFNESARTMRGRVR
jgi:DNA-binding MarR family transcriptional regulator